MIEKKRTLDLRGIYCPLNMVKTRLAVEQMQSGEELDIIFDDEGSLENVTKGLEKEGHKALRTTGDDNHLALLVEKC